MNLPVTKMAMVVEGCIVLKNPTTPGYATTINNFMPLRLYDFE